MLRIAVQAFPPFLFTGIRQITAGVILLLVFMLLKIPLQFSIRHLLRQAVAGFFMITLGNGLVAWGEMYVPSGVTAVICSTLPVAVIIINLVAHRVKPRLLEVAGTLTGLLGLLLMFSEHLADLVRPEYQRGMMCILLAVLSWAAGTVWLKANQTPVNPFFNAALQMLTGGALCLPFSLWLDSAQAVVFTSKVVYALGYLILFGSVLAYASYLYALRILPLAVVSLYAYINPVVAVVVGWLVLNEKLNSGIIFSTGIVLLGIFLVNRGNGIIALFKSVWKGNFRRQA